MGCVSLHVCVFFSEENDQFVCPYTSCMFQLKKNPSLDVMLADICIGTSAAPTYLPCHTFRNQDSEGNLIGEFDLIDGGVTANNPVSTFALIF